MRFLFYENIKKTAHYRLFLSQKEIINLLVINLFKKNGLIHMNPMPSEGYILRIRLR